MKMVTFTLPPAKCTICAWFALFLCMICRPASAQILAGEYTARDSAADQKALLASRSDADRINYQLEIAEYCIKKPGSFKIDLDNAQTYIDKAKKLNAKLNSRIAEGHILLEEGYLQQEYKHTPQAKETITKAIAILATGPDKSLLATAYRNLSYCYDINDPKQAATKVNLLKQSAKYYKQSGNAMGTAAILQHLAEMSEGDFPSTIKYVKESLAIYDSLRYPQVQGLYDLLGDAYYYISDYERAIKNHILSLKVSAQLKDSTMQVCETNNHLGIMYNEIKQPDKAIPYFKAALVLAKKHNDVSGIINIAGNIATSYNMLNDPKDALKIYDAYAGPYKNISDDNLKLAINNMYLVTFAYLKQPNRAAPYLENMLRAVNSPNINSNNLYIYYNGLVIYYSAVKDYNKALEFLQKNKKLAEDAHTPAKIASNLRYWYKMDSARNDYKNAFIHLLQNKQLQDTIFNEKKSQQITEMQTEYETEQKEAEIRLKNQNIQLLHQNAKLDQAQLKGAKLTRNITLAGIAVFILISGMQYRRYKEKQKLNLLVTNKNAELQKLVIEKEWLLKEVHHRVKNNLHTVICLLESQAVFLENDALKAVESSQHRIFAMSLVHQRLYQSTDIQTVDIANYLSEFIMYLKESFGEPANIVFQQEIESMRLDVSQAIPLALIVNEAITNAIKYAFPENRSGVIKIALAREADLIRLSIEDNGVGMPESVQTGNLSSLGLELIKGLTDDLKGKVQFLVKKGTSVIISFNKGPFSNIASAALN